MTVIVLSTRDPAAAEDIFIEVIQVPATTFIQPMKSGRNRPLLFGCENASGKT